MPNPADPQDLNRYSYVRNSPVRYNDPSGHSLIGGTTVDDAYDQGSYVRGTDVGGLPPDYDVYPEYEEVFGEGNPYADDFQLWRQGYALFQSDPVEYSKPQYAKVREYARMYYSAMGHSRDCARCAAIPVDNTGPAMACPGTWVVVMAAAVNPGAPGGLTTPYYSEDPSMPAGRQPGGSDSNAVPNSSGASWGGPKLPSDPATPPGPEWEWRGRGPPGSGQGNYYNPITGESLHPDLKHPAPIGPHWDYKAPDGSWWRIYPDGTMQPK